MLLGVNEGDLHILDPASERQARSETSDALPSPRRHAVDRSSQGWVRERPGISRPLRLQLFTRHRRLQDAGSAGAAPTLERPAVNARPFPHRAWPTTGRAQWAAYGRTKRRAVSLAPRHRWTEPLWLAIGAAHDSPVVRSQPLPVAWPTTVLMSRAA